MIENKGVPRSLQGKLMAICVAILLEELAHFEENDPEINALVIGSLADLQVMEAIPLMEQAFAAGKVDERTNSHSLNPRRWVLSV